MNIEDDGFVTVHPKLANPPRIRSSRIAFRLYPEERALIDAEAEKRGLEPAIYARSIVLQALKGQHQ